MPTQNDACRPITGARIETRLRVRSAALAAVAPSQGRGSKPVRRRSTACRSRVAPSKGRGSKHQRGAELHRQGEVAPSQGRGSKHSHDQRCAGHARSPHHRGADRNAEGGAVPAASPCRPITGARIETSAARSPSSSTASPHHRGADRNLDGEILWTKPFVAHHRGADRNRESCELLAEHWCRPITGARIETTSLPKYRRMLDGRPITGARIETLGLVRRRSAQFVAPSQGRGSKHALRCSSALFLGSPHHRGADRNTYEPIVVPPGFVAPSQGRGSKLDHGGLLTTSIWSPHHRGADRNSF